MKQQQQSLYDPRFEHDACGIGFIANLKGKKTHDNVRDALIMLENMEHRGGCGCEPNTGDGAGILLQLPHDFLVEELRKQKIELPEFGKYGVSMMFMPKDEVERAQSRKLFEEYAEDLDLSVLAYRVVPTNSKGIGSTALAVEPVSEQAIIVPKEEITSEELERKLFVLRKYANRSVHQEMPNTYDSFHIVSLSYKTIIYKGQLRTDQVKSYYTDLQNENVTSAIALVHSRFSTNTFPSWKLAQPFRYIAHNGEINTIQGNVSWMHTKQKLLESTLFTPKEIKLLLPICDERRSDSSNLDNVVELLVMGGRSLPEAMMMLIPEAWEEDTKMDDNKRAYYEYMGRLMEPWDGPASICFTDGIMVGATLDRNGLRPSRFCLTSDDRVIMSSEAGALPVDPSKILKKGRLQPGKIFVANLEEGRIISDEEIKEDICTRQPYRDWLSQNKVQFSHLQKPVKPTYTFDFDSLLTRQKAFGFTEEDENFILLPMATEGTEPVGSMGADTPIAVLSEQAQHISNYFKQRFAQVSNPPIDPIRERMVMSLFTGMWTTLNIWDTLPEHCRYIQIKDPVLTNEDLDKLKYINHPHFKSKTITALFKSHGKPGTLEKAIDALCQEAEDAVKLGNNIIIVSDRGVNRKNAAIPSLLALGAVHHHLIRKDLRARTGLVVEAGDVRETHHFATLIGYGANAVNPYMSFETIAHLRKLNEFPKNVSEKEAFTNYIKSIDYGLLKVFSKMGISTFNSYHGSQIFEALGLGKEVIEKCFRGTVSRIGGLDFEDLQRETLTKHYAAYPLRANEQERLPVGGLYQWKRRGEHHIFNPETISLLQHSTRQNNYSIYKQYAEKINDQTKKSATLRGLFKIKSDRSSISIDEVESKEKIFKRFATGAMSFGSISYEAHSTLAIAMNRIGGKSNSGEGGEDEIRYAKKPNGDWERSAIKQVASGRFGVTANYLTNADELQIKMAQGAKPGEGGQLPGHKVDEWIGRVRHSTPGVGLISPPPHHDIYSIEDLAQLIFDLKNANREARINVKLVAEIGVGTIAAGVAKAKADVVLVSGYDGGTGASPISSIRHAGIPWELGLAEAHQTLVQNDLRSRIIVQTDGQLRTGRDMVIATLLGAEEWGIATAALVVEGCIMMRKCHLNTCPVGVATQDKDLRKLFSGDPDHVVNFFTFLAEDIREIMAELGFRTIDEMVGQVHLLEPNKEMLAAKWKLNKLDLSSILYQRPACDGVDIYHTKNQEHDLDNVLDWKILEIAKPALEKQQMVEGELNILNTNRSVGAITSNEISKKYGGNGLAEDLIHIKFRGSAGQSFGVFATKGLKFELEGEGNDYFGKGLSGGKLIVYPDRTAKFQAKHNSIIGNVAFYGATSGIAFIRGIAGERFCVRNSGVEVVVEGVGDHGCEYMTGGRVIVLGQTGKNFAAGMSGGIAYVYDPEKDFARTCNRASVDLESLDFNDERYIKEMVTEHRKLTKSGTAKFILKHWDIEINNFVKVMPRDYKKALTAMKKKGKLTKKKENRKQQEKALA